MRDLQRESNLLALRKKPLECLLIFVWRHLEILNATNFKFHYSQYPNMILKNLVIGFRWHLIPSFTSAHCRVHGHMPYAVILFSMTNSSIFKTVCNEINGAMKITYIIQLFVGYFMPEHLKDVQNFPGGTVDGRSACQCRQAIPDLRRFRVPQKLKPIYHNYWACVLHLQKPTWLEPVLHNKSSTIRSLCTTKKSSPHLSQLEKAHAQQWRPTQPKINR